MTVTTSAEMTLVMAIMFAIEIAWTLVLDDIVLGAVGEAGDVLDRFVFTDDQDIMLAVPSGTGLPLGDHHHGLHGDDHAGIKHGVDILAQFDTGLAATLARGALDLAGPIADSPLGLLALATLLMTYLTEIASNTATTSMMIPVLLAIAQELGIDPLPMALCVTMAASNAFMLPVSTPPNAIVYGGGHVRLGEMIRTGFALDLLGFAVIVACGALLLPILGLG